MAFPTYRELKPGVDSSMNRGQLNRILLIYTAISLGASVLTLALKWFFDSRIGTAGGIANIGLRSFYSSAGTFLEVAKWICLSCLELGLMSAMLRTVRGMYTSPMTLKTGLDRFFPLMRVTVLKSLITMGVGVASIYAGSAIFSFSPFSNQLVTVMAPMVSEGGADLESFMENEAFLDAISGALLPVLGFAALIFLVFGLPILYRLRFSLYVLLDHPELPSFGCISVSRRLLRRNFWKLLILDIHLWWYYAAQVVSSLLLFLPELLSLVGIVLPISDTVNILLSYGLYFVAQGFISYYLYPRATAFYALCYDAFCPKEKPSQGAVLGSIFQ